MLLVKKNTSLAEKGAVTDHMLNPKLLPMGRETLVYTQLNMDIKKVLMTSIVRNGCRDLEKDVPLWLLGTLINLC